MKFSANLGFLWTELPLAEAIHRAAAAGFAAVECHWPFDQPVEEVRAALSETGLPMLGLNTVRGDVEAGEFGLAALPGREVEARAAIDQALDYAAAIGAGAVHVMCGKASGPDAERAFANNLSYACERAGDRTILIEPINPHDVPGYHLSTTAHAAALIGDLGAPNLRLMFDCYHVGRSEGDVCTRLAALMPIIGHVQIAAVPDRGAPDHGELHYPYVLETLTRLGYDQAVGAEYRPGGPTGDTLDWLKRYTG